MAYTRIEIDAPSNAYPGDFVTASVEVHPTSGSLIFHRLHVIVGYESAGSGWEKDPVTLVNEYRLFQYQHFDCVFKMRYGPLRFYAYSYYELLSELGIWHFDNSKDQIIAMAEEPGPPPGDEVAFSGELTRVDPAHSGGYYSGEEVKLIINAHIEADGLGWGDFWWSSCYKIFSQAGQELYSDCRLHSTAPWTSHDEADDAFEASIGVMPGVPLVGQVELYGWRSGYPNKPKVLVDIKEFYVPLKGATPPPPPPECDDGETMCAGTDLYTCVDGEWQLTERNAAQCYTPPIPPGEGQFPWKWVAIGGLGGLALGVLLLLLPGKGSKGT